MKFYQERDNVLTFKPMSFHDITKKVFEMINRSGISNGHVVIQSLNTTVGIYLNEMEKRLLKYDVPEELLRCYPIRTGRYKHDDIELRSDCPNDEPINGHSHLMAMFSANPSLSLVLVNGVLQLGQYQRIIFAEFDGPCPRKHKGIRKYVVSVIGE